MFNSTLLGSSTTTLNPGRWVPPFEHREGWGSRFYCYQRVGQPARELPSTPLQVRGSTGSFDSAGSFEAKDHATLRMTGLGCRWLRGPEGRSSAGRDDMWGDRKGKQENRASFGLH